MYTIKDILRLEVAPALGCTEPAAVAFCSAAARSLFPDIVKIEAIELLVDKNVYKNGMAVAIPGTPNLNGIDVAAALGALCGDPSLKLEGLRTVTPACVEEATKLVAEKKVSVKIDPEAVGIHIHCRLVTSIGTADAVVEGVHDNLTRLTLDGHPVASHPLLSDLTRGHNELESLETWLRERTLRELLALLEQLDEEDIEFLKTGLEYNLALANHGLTYGCGLGVGKTLDRLCREGLMKKDMVLAARILTAAASDARMSGVSLPAMSSGGSGNHGLTAILPILAIREFIVIDGERDVLRAIALSHLVTAYIKAFTGRLSALCGCSVAAGAGATAAVTFLLGGNLVHISGAIKNLLSDLAGIICDGAKNGCALKLATAAGTAVQSALFALHGIQVSPIDGIVAASPEQTVENIGLLCTNGMIEADRTILQIMVNKHFS